jgi:hypothetical protein
MGNVWSVIVFGIGLQILVGVLAGLGVGDFDYESTASNFFI